MRSVPIMAGALVAGMALHAHAARAAGASAPTKVSILSVKSSSESARQATRAAVRQHERELLACHQQALAKDPEPTAAVTLSCTVEANGSISGPKADFLEPRFDAAGDRFLSCLTARAAAWRLAKPEGGPASVEISLEFSARPGPEPTETTPATGSIDEQAMREVIQSHGAEVIDCYQQELARDRHLEGKVTLKWTVRADGSVTNARVDRDGTTLRNRKVHECVTSRVSGWKFPRPEGGDTAVITNAWVFRAQVQAPGSQKQGSP